MKVVNVENKGEGGGKSEVGGTRKSRKKWGQGGEEKEVKRVRVLEVGWGRERNNGSK